MCGHKNIFTVLFYILGEMFGKKVKDNAKRLWQSQKSRRREMMEVKALCVHLVFPDPAQLICKEGF